MPNTKHVTVDQVIEVLADLQTKADGRFRALVTKIVESDLGSDLAAKINGKADQTEVTTLSGKVSTLIGSETGDDAKSVRTISAEEVAKVVAEAPASYDTLKEIADWILNDTTGAAKMANDISALKTKTTLGTDGSGNEYATVKAYVEAYVAEIVGSAYTEGDGIEIDSNRVVSVKLTAGNGLGIDGSGNIVMGAASQSAAGAMSAEDKTKLDGFEVATATDIAAIKATIWPSA